MEPFMNFWKTVQDKVYTDLDLLRFFMYSRLRHKYAPVFFLFLTFVAMIMDPSFTVKNKH